MHVVVVGLNHRSAPIELRERLAFSQEQLPDILRALRAHTGVPEAAVLSTCNRVEIYAGVPELNGTIGRVQEFLSAHGRVELPGLQPRLYSYTEPDSVRHLFAVASGLDSMILGESEILHQVKHAYERARDCGATGKVLNALFQRALNTAKTVRSETAIGSGCTSIGTVAVELAEKIFGRLSQAAVLLIGAGKVGALTLERLAQRGVRDVRLMNRTHERAVQLAQDTRVMPLAWEALSAQLADVDILISSTSAPSFVLRHEDVVAAMRRRHQRPLCIIDLGVPRNVEPAVETMENVYLFDIDDLQGLVDHSSSERAQALVASEAIISQKVERFLSWRQKAIGNAECGVRNGRYSELHTPNSTFSVD